MYIDNLQVAAYQLRGGKRLDNCNIQLKLHYRLKGREYWMIHDGDAVMGIDGKWTHDISLAAKFADIETAMKFWNKKPRFGQFEYAMI